MRNDRFHKANEADAFANSSRACSSVSMSRDHGCIILTVDLRANGLIRRQGTYCAVILFSFHDLSEEIFLSISVEAARSLTRWCIVHLVQAPNFASFFVPLDSYN